ncbi:MAG: macrocin O-methyltransferase [Deltaproteobacteria bacterium]|nr:macrocin O-methyltransferase [Deltaproteobacteria bacterium]
MRSSPATPRAAGRRPSSTSRLLRRGPGSLYRQGQSLRFLLTRDRREVLDFLRADYPLALSRRARLALLRDFLRTTHALRGYHTLEEMLRVCDRIFRRAGQGEVVVVEAGSGSGSSTAKLSLAVRKVGGRLLVFDTFQGIPENDERHEHLDGRPLVYRKGAFRGRLESVRRHVERFGAPEVCTFHKGLFEETLPGLDAAIDVALLDVDLIASTRVCTRHLFPLLKPGGVLFSQDGHIRATVELFADERFWREDVGVAPPAIPGLGEQKLLEIVRPA